MRTVEFSGTHEGVWQELQTLPGTNAAIGYLSTWAMPSETCDGYENVKIFAVNKEGWGTEMCAQYKNEKNGNTYTIGAIYSQNRKEWSFHS